MRLSHPLLLASLGVLFAAASCTLITDVDRSKIPDGMAGTPSGGDSNMVPSGGEPSANGGNPSTGGTSTNPGGAGGTEPGAAGSDGLGGAGGMAGAPGAAGMATADAGATSI